MGMIKEFKEFALKGNMVDMAVGIVIGGAFGKVVSALVEKIFMPPLGLISGGIDFSQQVAELKGASGDMPAVELGYGSFIQAVIDFLIVAFALFLVIKAINTAKKRFEEEEQAAPSKPSQEVQLLTEIRDALVKN